jgi:integrase/recombinase XerD
MILQIPVYSHVKRLKFEDFHWKENQIVIIQSKTGEPLTLPLLRDVGWAIIDYVQNGRPESDNPHIFLKHVAPYTGCFL